MVRIEPRGFRLLRFWALGTLLHLGCTLITDVDRSKIPVPPPFEPTVDAGPTPEADAGADAAGEPDAADAAPAPEPEPEPEPQDAAVIQPDAAPSGDAG